MGISVEYSAGSCFFLAMLCLLLPVDWLLAALAAAFLHEMCHIAAVLALGGKLERVHIGAAGVILEVSPMSSWQTLICTLAGPAGSLALLLLGGICPKLAFCGMVQGLYNLLPFVSLDGGRILFCVTHLLFSEKTADMICIWIPYFVVLMLLLLGLWAALIKKLGLMPLLAAVYLLSGMLPGKTPCKDGKLAVQ